MTIPGRQINRIALRSKLLARRWLSDQAFSVELVRPRPFTFAPGQRIGLLLQGVERDYSLVSAPDDSGIELCVRKVEKGRLSRLLAAAEIGTPLRVSPPLGHFTFKRSLRSAVFAATGTGIAPFVSMARSGVQDYILLHGAELPEHLYYESTLRQSARLYVPCLTGRDAASRSVEDAFSGRVTGYLRDQLVTGEYDFYLCGRAEMIRDVTFIIDERFPGSRVYTERFY